MTKQWYKLLALLVVAMLAFSGCSMVKVDKAMDDAEIVAEYTGGTILKGAAMEEYSALVDMYAQYGITDTETLDSLKGELLDYMIGEAVKKAKAEELGFTNITDEQKQTAKDTAAASYNEVLEFYSIYFGGEGVSEEEVKTQTEEYLQSQGYTLEAVEQQELDNIWTTLLYDEATKDVVLTDEALKAHYDTLVEGDEATYSEDLMSFEYAMSSGETVTWYPEGYRTVRHILLPYTDEQVEKLGALESELEDVNTAITNYVAPEDELADEVSADSETVEPEVEPEAEPEVEPEVEPEAEPEATAEAVIESDGAAEPEATAEPEPETVPAEEDPENLADESEESDIIELDEADLETDPSVDALEENLTLEQLNEKKATLEGQIADLKVEYMESLKDKIAEVQAKIAEGQDFDALIVEYGEDPGMEDEANANGYYVCATSETWEKIFTETAMALKAVGDVSEPVAGSSGVHIIKYVSDVTPGPVPFEDMRDALSEETLTELKDTAFEEKVAEWVAAANVKKYVDRMN